MDKPTIVFTCLAPLLILGENSLAHHSFAIYDIDNKISRTGILNRFEFKQPHIQLELEVDREDGSKEIWQIESMAPQRWDRLNNSRDVASVGETVTIFGWPARDGSDAMVLSSIVTERGETVILERVRQRRARENIPEVTIKRE
jgi:hypothetical protein